MTINSTHHNRKGSVVRVLIVDDYIPWRQFVGATLRERCPGLEIADEAADGWEAVRKARQLQPDLILMDIGLPGLNGIEAASRIREHTPTSAIIFLSENRCLEIVQEALHTGALGYVVKSDTASDLMPAVEAALQGRQFVSSSVAGHEAKR